MASNITTTYPRQGPRGGGSGQTIICSRGTHSTTTNHFGARKQRSTEQALMLLQERIYRAWRQRKVLSLISFDVKGAYNGVYKERLLQRLRARRIPPSLCRWVDAFCSDRTATLSVNRYESEKQGLPQAGLPHGSPLSPILFLFSTPT